VSLLVAVFHDVLTPLLKAFSVRTIQNLALFCIGEVFAFRNANALLSLPESFGKLENLQNVWLDKARYSPAESTVRQIGTVPFR